MPLGPGIQWSLNGQFFKKNVMKAGTSLGAVQWINFIQQSDMCVDSAGNRIQIEHLYHQGEKDINGYEIDGYFQKDGKEYFLEYNGKFYSLYGIDHNIILKDVHIIPAAVCQMIKFPMLSIKEITGLAKLHI